MTNDEFYKLDKKSFKQISKLLGEVFSHLQKSHSKGSLLTFQYCNMFSRVSMELSAIGNHYVPMDMPPVYTFVKLSGDNRVGYIHRYLTNTKVKVLGELEGEYELSQLQVVKIA